MSDHDEMPSIDALEDKIGSIKESRELGSTSGGSVSHGTRAGLDLVAGVTVGTVSGYLLDQWTNTLPLFMLICMGLGTAAGVKLMIETSNRASQKLEEEEKERLIRRTRVAGDNHSPLAQFEIQTLADMPELAGYNIDFTNSSLFMVIACIGIVLFLGLGMRGKLVPGRWQSMVELSYSFIAGTVKDNMGKDGKDYFPFIFTLFMFILFCNLLGMIPFSFTVTSHIIVTFALAGFIFVACTLIAIFKHGIFKFLGSFLPDGTPWWMAPMMYLIELFSFLARPISLSVRLMANMMAGHTMLKVIAGFVLPLGIFGIAPMVFLVVLTGFEVFVAILQAYIFAVLTCVYLNQSLHLH